ncbi:glycosyltransferase [Thioalkalivibrio sulfidiphilus]|uniref:glycosyltransferase n=2 Tax=Thioalkalivibrio sulfidiphilus TaxID=1033854 RepID=UPI003B335C74
MRFTHVMLSAGFGGAERYFVDLCGALARRGHQIQAICQRDSESHHRLAAASGIEVVPIRVLGAWDPLARRAIRKALGRFSPHLVHTHLARGAWLGGRAAHSLGLPVMTKLHNYVKLKYYRHVDWFNVTTLSQQDYLRQQGIDPGRIRVIPNFSSFPPATGPRAVNPAARITWASFGRFVHKKGFDLLLDAFARLRRDHLDARLMLGGDGEEAPRLRARVQEAGLKDAVEFSGWVTDVAGFLDRADIFVLPSRDEPFGIAVLEAMARGVPIVSTRTQGPSEILDETTAWLCTVDSVDDLYQAMSDAAANPEQRLARAGRALACYRDSYHEDAILPRLISMYDEISLNSRKAP